MEAHRIPNLQARLKGRANPKTKAWWERYLKGVKIAGIRGALHLT